MSRATNLDHVVVSIVLAAIALAIAGCGSLDPSPDDLASHEVQPLRDSQEMDAIRSDAEKLSALRHKLIAEFGLRTATPQDSVEFDRLRAHFRVRGVSSTGVDDDRAIAAMNRRLTDFYRDTEAEYYRSARKGELPKLCLAMSGGGSRSAAFNIGVLIALHQLGILERIDAFSAVSGGAYALGWLQLNLAEDSVTLDGLLGEHDPQKSAPGHYRNIRPTLIQLVTDVLNAVHAWRTLQPGYSAALGGRGTPNGIDPSSPRSAYAEHIRNAFLHPRGKSPPISYDPQQPGAATTQPAFSPNALSETLKRRQIVGYPIFNVATFPLREHWGHAFAPEDGNAIQRQALVDRFLLYSLNDVLFEMSPLRQGSDGLGYTDKWPPQLTSWAEVIALSGAAIDSPFFPNSERAIQMLYGGPLRLWLPKSILAPADEPRVSGQQPISLYITDGGFSENLGLFPLVKRLCSEIIVVDAEHDPTWLFEAYGILRERLQKEHEINLDIPDVESIIKKTRAGKATRADGVSIPVPEAACDPNKRKSPYTSACFHGAAAANSVFKGSIGRIPVTDAMLDTEPCGIGHCKTLRLTYIKLGADLKDTARLPDGVRTYVNECRGLQGNTCQFPHDATDSLKGQQYTHSQFNAYCSLGYSIVIRNADAFPGANKERNLRTLKCSADDPALSNTGAQGSAR